MALTWTLSLKDKISPGAKSAATALKSTEKALEGVKKSTSNAQTAIQRLSWRKLVLGNRDAVGKFIDTGDKIREGLRRIFGENSRITKAGGWAVGMAKEMRPVGQALASVASYAAGAQLALFGMAAGGIYAVRNAQAFKSDTMFAFRQILGTKEAAQSAYDLAAKTSIKIGGDFQETMSAMNSLLAQGFSTNFADEIIRAMADLKTVNPQANLEGITRAISQIKTTGRLQGDELMQLAEAGVNVSDVYKKIAASMKLTDKPGQTAVEQVQKLQAAGKISADEAIKGIMGSIKGQIGGKEFGSVASAKADASLEGMIARLKNLGTQSLAAVNVDWSPMTSAIQKVVAAMSSPAGKKLFDAIGASISKVVGAFGNITDGDITSGFEKAAELITKVGDEVASVLKLMIAARPVFEMVGSVLGTGLSAAAFVADTLAAAIGAVKSLIDGASQSLGPIAGAVGAAVSPANSLASAFDRIASSSASAAASIRTIASGAATSAVLGVGGGLLGRASGGPVNAGQTYVVGERGPELFTPGQSGNITPNGASERMMAAGREIRGALTQSTSNDNSRNVNITANVGGGTDANGRRALISDLRSLVLAHV